MRLAELQRAFQHRVLAGDRPPGAERAIEADRAIEPELVRPAAADVGERLGAYVHGYRSRLVEALAICYPALQKTLGADEFDRHMRNYIDACPSRHYSVRYYGAGVADLMARDGDAGGGADGDARTTLSDLGRWEWLLADVFDAPDDAPLAAADLGAVPADAWAGVSFHLRASVRRVALRSNAIEFWRAASGVCAPPAACATAPATEWLAWRRGVSVFFRSLDAVEAMALDGALRGESFAALCERLAVAVDATDVALRAASLLRGWIAEELVAGYVLPGPAP